LLTPSSNSTPAPSTVMRLTAAALIVLTLPLAPASQTAL